jgi:DtxR family Mn-dependent transcriptional regulator
VKTAISVSKEDYLKAILEAESEGRTVISATLAHWLEVSPPAVSMALRHHLIERMLSEMFGMPWYEVHDEAERLEHAVSPAFEALLMKKLGEKGTCPHGNAVLPESDTKRKKHGVRPLAEVAEGTDCTVTSLYERDPKLLRFLHQTGIEPGGDVRVLQRNYDQTMAIETPAGHFTIGPAAAEKVRVKRGAGRAAAANGGRGR